MNKTKSNIAILLLCVLTFICLLATSLASAEISPYASPVFESGYVVTGNNLFTEFGASAHKICKKIYISSCTLQEMNSKGEVVSSTKLTPPSTIATNTSNYTAWATYSGTKGKQYRIMAVFVADGYTITRYPNTVTYK